VTEADDRRRVQDDLLIVALARGLSSERAGEVAGVSGRTVRRRMRDPGFGRRVREVRDQWVDRVTGQLIGGASDAVNTIVVECRDGERSADRLRAASLLLGLGLRYRQAAELEARVRELETRLGLTTDGAGPGEDES
jgi:hypothetical protein